MQEISDQQIIDWLLKRPTQEKGFKALAAKYQERLYWHIRRMVQEHDDANDILQEVFIKIFRKIDTFKQQSQLYTWMHRIATNETLTFLQKQKRRAAASIDQEDLNLGEQLQADAHFNGAEAQALLKKAIAQLPEKQRLVFNMRYYEDHTYDELSKILDTSTGALKASYHHAVKKIEAYLKQFAI